MTNDGDAPLNLSTGAITGPDAASFTFVDGGNSCATTVAVGASCTIEVLYDPTAVGSKSAEFVLTPVGATQAPITVRLHADSLADSIYKAAGSVHGCGLFRGEELLMFVEDVGRHNAIDTIAGWMWMNDISGQDKVFYTTGRLTSEMVIKSAQMGVPVVVSRSGITQMGLDVAKRLGLCAIGRATNKRVLCFSAPERMVWQTALAST